MAAGDLRIGETLKTLTGTARVESITKRPDPEPVYNIEVEGDHVYRVGESGVLVHNASFKENCDPCEHAQLHENETFTDRSGKSMKGTWEQITQNGKVQVCRVKKVEGDIKTTPRNSLDADNARRKMGHFFFNNNPPTNQSEQQKVLSSELDAGHLIADTLGGPNDARNLVPMDSKIQQSGGAWRAFEQTWLQKTCFKDDGIKKKGYMVVTMAYPRRTKASTKDDPLPSYIPTSWKVTLTLYSSNENKPTVHRFQFKNNPMGRSKNFPKCLKYDKT